MFTIEDNVITVVKGDTGSFTFSLDNHVLDIGDVVKFTVKKNIDDTIPILSKEIRMFENGVATIDLSKFDTNVEPGKYIYDIEVNLTNGIVDTVILPSLFKVLKGVTD